jgi:hypothetical protein
LNNRHGALFPSKFVTYRKQTDDTPSKVWAITSDVGLSPVTDRSDYHLRHAGTSTLWAVARGAYDVKRMWTFTITWAGRAGGPDKLTLALESKEEADEWHAAFAGAIAKATARRSPGSASSSSGRSLGSAEAEASLVGPTAGVDGAQGGTDGGATAAPGGGARRSRAWASVLHINGISVYVEEQDEEGEGGAVMVSAVVRAPPADVFKASAPSLTRVLGHQGCIRARSRPVVSHFVCFLLQSLVQVRRTEGLGVFAGARTLEVIDATTQVVAQGWKGSGALGG